MKNNYEIRGEITAIFLKSGDKIVETIINTSKLEIAKSFPNTWYAAWCPSRNSYYVSGHLPRQNGRMKNITLHRWILSLKDSKMEVDHFDNDTLNNTDNNLRICTRAQNLQNRKIQRNNSSGYRGVCLHKKTGKWQANLRIDGKFKYLGLYASKEEAGKVVAEARRKHMPFSKEAAGVRA